MANYDDITRRWLDIILHGSDKQNYTRRGNVFAIGDQIFSYGSHFEMARILRDKKGQPNRFLLNGDRYSTTTSSHQNIVRNAIRRTGLPSVIIPYSALEAAGVDRDSVEIIEATEDRHEAVKHREYAEPHLSRWVDDMKMGPVTQEQIDEWVANTNQSRREAHERWGATQGRELVLATADDMPEWTKTRYQPTGTQHLETRYGVPITVTPLDDGRTAYEWETHRHWLGESLIRAEVRTVTWDDQSQRQVKVRKGYYLSGFDHQESTPLYFFCELPTVKAADRPTTVTEAYELLKPEPVKVAEETGRRIVRQGDIFAVELEVDRRTLTKAGAKFEKRGNLLGTNHEASEVAYLPNGVTVARGVLYHNPPHRERDHARRKLNDGKKWYAIAKNTVPVAA